MTPDAPKGPWPELPLEPWRGTLDALHLMSQLVGKTLLSRCTPQNHWWHTALRVTARGIAGGAPVCDGERALELELDLVDHILAVRTGDRERSMSLAPRSMHAFYDAYRALLRDAGVDVHVWTTPVEVLAPVPFEQDDAPRPYDREAANRFWQVLRRCDAALRGLAAGYVGKQSPVHFFWGSFDLASTRFSGRRAPERPGADPVTREAYSHEEISFGFWPGGTTQTGISVDEPVIYTYAAPEPDGFRDAEVPAPARYDTRLGEFLLSYGAVRTDPDPAARIQEFCEAAYDAGATLGEWDRAALERGPEPAAAMPASSHHDVHPAGP